MTHKFAKSFFALLIAIGLVFTVSYATAQSSVSGSIGGTVSDASGAVISGATVTITNTDRGEDIRVVKTSAAGYFMEDALPLGNYKVTITASNFKTEVVTGLVLHAADEITVDRKLTPGGANEIITVSTTDNLVNVNLEDAASSGLINNEQLNEMPLVTRNYETLMNLMPGVVFGGATDDLTRGPAGLSGSSSTVSFSVNGGRNTSNGWTIDGADNLDRGANLTLYTYPSPDAISEFTNMRGQYSAQFGRNASGQIDVVTKSGTNSLHGSAYEYLRNNYFDANTYLNDFHGGPASASTFQTPVYRYNVFGFSAGGPVWIPKIYNGKDKTFFFVSEEFQRIVQVLAAATATVPQASERNGDFTQSGQLIGGVWTTAPVTVCTAFTNNSTTQVNTCTATGTSVTSGLSPTAQAYMKDVFANVPVPNVAFNIAHNTDPHTIYTNFKDIFNNLDSVVRIDQQFGQKLNVFYRYLHDTFPETLPQGQFTTVYIAGANTTTVVNPGSQQLAHGTYVFSPTLLLNVGYSFSNGNIVSTPSGFLSSAQSPDVKPTLVYPNTVGLIPNLSIAGMTALSGSVAYTDHGTNHQAYGDLTKTLHTHTLIFGFSYNHYQKLENNTTGTQGGFTFASDSGFANVPTNNNGGANEAQGFANFLTGNANGGFSQLSRDPVTDQKFGLWEGFAQDNWKVMPRLTLNLGVRYGYYGQPWDANGLMSNFDPAKYTVAAAPTIASSGLICITSPCSQAGSNVGLSTTANASADIVGINYIDGIIYNGPNAANNNQASPWGNKVGQAQKANFAPRFGFAYDLFGNGKTSLRGGYGWSYDNAEVSYYETTVFDNPPAVSTYSVSESTLDTPAGGANSAFSSTPARIQGVPLTFQTPYVQQFSLDIQQELAPKFMMDLGYFGDHGTHLLGALDIDQPVPGAWLGTANSGGSYLVNPETNSSGCFIAVNGVNVPANISSTCTRVVNQIEPYLGYGAIDALRTIFNSNYNSLQVKATKRFSGTTYLDANVTWSRDLTNAPADYSGFIQNEYNINGDYGRASLDRNKVFNFDGVFEEPWFREQKNLMGRALGGWELSFIYTIDSGLPSTVAASAGSTVFYNLGGAASVYNNLTGGGEVSDNAGLHDSGPTSDGLRVNQIGDPNSPGNLSRIHNKNYEVASAPWFYSGAFAAPAPNNPVPANAKRGTIQGPGFNRLDLGVHRNFKITERTSFQFRAEAFNAINHVNVNAIGTTATSSTFGEVTGYRDMRIMQFAGRFTF
ncbi:MAG: carboxypeptidase-like regulatory domain-containing protein [Terracidiphilus sp.]|jgi:hypothetical protein